MANTSTKLLDKVWKEFVYGGHLLSLGASAIVLSFLLLFELKIEWQVFIVPYLLSQLIYGFDHFYGAKKDGESNPERAKHFLKHKVDFYIVNSFYLATLSYLFFTFLRLENIYFILLFLLAGILYTLVIKDLTKKIFALKNFYVAISWAILIFIPIIQYGIGLEDGFFIFAVIVFVRWLINTIFFDIKDIENDRKDGLKNFPTVFGINGTVKLLKNLNILFLLILVGATYFQIIPWQSLMMMPLFVYSYYYLSISEESDKEMIRKISYIFVDGEYIFWPALIYLGKVLI